MSTPLSRDQVDRPPRWPWLLLAFGLIWTVTLRIPLIDRAADHLDSDLAVDGLTLLDAVRGDWRWHYPGTPHMGSLPVLLSYPHALMYGVGPETLVGGGTVAWMLVIVATFLLAWRGFGPGVACWALVPLVFSSVGTVWLSGRITGGHLLTLAWHAGAFVGLVECLKHGREWRVGLLGLWCGVGLWLDAMFLFTVLGVALAAVWSWSERGRSKRGIVSVIVFAVGLGIGASPREIGKSVDPHDPYNEQFSPILVPDVLVEHARILVMECLPRLIVGHELPELQSTPEALTELGQPTRKRPTTAPAINAGPILTAFGLLLFGAAMVRMVVEPSEPGSASRAVQRGTLLSAGLIVLGFLVNRNIFNSDNYRYLIFLLVPWSIGFGLLMRRIASGGAAAWASTLFLSAAFGALMTASVVSWYIGLGWLSIAMLRGSPETSNRVVFADELPSGIDSDEGTPPTAEGVIVLPAETSHVFGDYWTVYRLAFLSGGRVVGVPFPTYPNRFEGWSRGLGPGEGALLVRDPGPDWRGMLRESWSRDGRDPSELDQLTILAPETP